MTHPLTRRNASTLLDPFVPLDRIFDMGLLPRAEVRRWPPLDVTESDDAFQVSAEVPGFRPEDIKVSFERDLLTIEAERSEGLKDEARRISERRFGSFKRTLRVGVAIDVEKIEARAEHGVLHVRLPKAEEARAKLIRVEG